MNGLWRLCAPTSGSGVSNDRLTKWAKSKTCVRWVRGKCSTKTDWDAAAMVEGSPMKTDERRLFVPFANAKMNQEWMS